MIPLNQLIPECLLALGGAFMLGNLAAYIRLRPAWREAKDAPGTQHAKRGANGTRPAKRGANGAVTARASRRVNARVREPTGPGSKLPSRTRVLANVMIGLVITVAALATLIRG